MNKSIFYSSNLLKYYFFVIHIWIIFYSSIFYLSEKKQENLFLLSNCQINKTLIECSKTNLTLCQINYYEIIYGFNYFGYFKSLPTWFSPIDKQNLLKNPNIKSMNLSCYYDRLTHQYIRWSKPNPEKYLYFIILSSLIICLTIIHWLDRCFCQKR